jgi:maltooligosyltrehalose synthase
MEELQEQVERERSAQDDEQLSLSHRMSALSAHHHEVLRDVRAKVRAIAERALREGKAERPHANA